MTEAELDEMERRGEGSSWDCIDVPAVFAEVRRLRQELKGWGEHEAGCANRYTESELRHVGWSPERVAGRVCTCGFDETLR